MRTSWRMYWDTIVLFGVLILTGCITVGPNYIPPETEVSEKWNTDLKGGLSTSMPSLKTLAQWWTVLDDPTLTNLIERAVSGNLSLKEARARIRQARATRGIDQAGNAPTVNAGVSETTSRSSEHVGTGKRARTLRHRI